MHRFSLLPAYSHAICLRCEYAVRVVIVGLNSLATETAQIAYLKISESWTNIMTSFFFFFFFHFSIEWGTFSHFRMSFLNFTFNMCCHFYIHSYTCTICMKWECMRRLKEKFFFHRPAIVVRMLADTSTSQTLSLWMNKRMRKRADFGKHIRKDHWYPLVYLPILVMCLQWVIVKLKGIWTWQNAPFSFSFTHAVFCSSSTNTFVYVGLSCFSEWKSMQHVALKLIQKQTPP